MTFDRAWRTLVDEDATRRAPAELEARVQQAIAADRARTSQHGPRVITALVTAASIGIAAVWSLSTSTPASIAVTPNLRDEGTRHFAGYTASAVPESPVVIPERRKPATHRNRETVVSAMRSSASAMPQEAFQLVRLRLPRQALATLGFLLIDPEATGVVDVDLLVGEDGLPRHIRKVWFEP